MRTTTLLIVFLVCVLTGACAIAAEPQRTAEPERTAEPQRTAEPELASKEDKLLYTLGLALAREMGTLEFNEDELVKIQVGFADGMLGRDARFPAEIYGPQVATLLDDRLKQIVERNGADGKLFVEAASGEPGAEVTPSGLVYRVVTPGTGPVPQPGDTVRVHYRARRHDGTEFDTTLEGDDPQPTEFVLAEIIECFGEGIGRMKVGGKSRLTCPPELAYGDAGSAPDIAPGETIQFDVELVEIVPGFTPAEPAGEAGSPDEG